MRGLVIRWLVSASALYLTSLIVDGIQVQGPGALLFAALTIGILNAFVRPVVFLFTLPLTLLTLGLFTVVINAGMLWLASEVVRGFHVVGLWAAVGGTLLLSVFTFIINLLVSDSGRIEVMHVRRVRRS